MGLYRFLMVFYRFLIVFYAPDNIVLEVLAAAPLPYTIHAEDVRAVGQDAKAPLAQLLIIIGIVYY